MSLTKDFLRICQVYHCAKKFYRKIDRKNTVIINTQGCCIQLRTNTNIFIVYVSQLNMNCNNIKTDGFVKSLILLAPQAMLGFMTRMAKLQELGLTPSNSLQFLTPGSS